MKAPNGRILMFFGVIHPLLGVSPFAFGEQFSTFAGSLFFKISDGLLEFPLLGGQMNFERFAAFWFFYFGLLLIPLGILVAHIEREEGRVPRAFVWAYFIVVAIGVYMIPFSGMTIFMLPHAIYMLLQKSRLTKDSARARVHEPGRTAAAASRGPV